MREKKLVHISLLETTRFKRQANRDTDRGIGRETAEGQTHPEAPTLTTENVHDWIR